MKNEPKTIERLTRGEEEIMQILWDLKTATVSEVIDRIPAPQPKYTTVATFLKILEKKGYATHSSDARTHRHEPLVSREEYADTVARTMLRSYFGGSLSHLVSFFSERKNLSLEEADQIARIIDESRKKK